jgi:beta-galactosidase/beta-glucuronidase
VSSPPLPLEVRERRVSLDGTWEIELEPGAAPVAIEVPFTFESSLSGIGAPTEIHERVRYRRTFRVPEAWRESAVLLRFGGVDWRTRVRVDGEEVGSHTGGYTHFSFDLGHVDPDVEHELVVEVEDPADGYAPRGKQRGSGGIWYARTTGIWRPVWLEAVAEPDGDAPEIIVRGDETRTWSPEDPYLTEVEICHGRDRVLSYRGNRTVELRGGKLVLNGEPRFVCGVLDQAFWPDGVYSAASDDALRRDVELTKELGFDLARMHVKVADPRWYGWCDRLGLMVAQDIPSPLRLDTEEARESFVREVDEIVEQLRGHPCIVMWLLFNEDWGEPPEDFQRMLVERVRAADPTRIVVDASGWKHRGVTDLIDVHDYGDDLSKHASGELPVLVGECGGVSLVVAGEEDFAYKHVTSGDELAREYERLTQTLGDVVGFVWTQLTDVEGELNGLLTHDRQHKAPPEMIRAANERAKGSRR